jgi:hypothetical protein
MIGIEAQTQMSIQARFNFGAKFCNELTSSITFWKDGRMEGWKLTTSQPSILPDRVKPAPILGHTPIILVICHYYDLLYNLVILGQG